MAFVRGVIWRSIKETSRLNVVSSMSTNTGTASSNSTQLADATKLKGVVITSSPRPMPSAFTARWSAAVPLLVAVAKRAPT